MFTIKKTIKKLKAEARAVLASSTRTKDTMLCQITLVSIFLLGFNINVIMKLGRELKQI